MNPWWWEAWADRRIRRRATSLLGALAVALLLSGWLSASSAGPSPDAHALHASVAPLAAPSAAAGAPEDEPRVEPAPVPAVHVIEGSIAPGQSLSTALRKHGVDAALVHTIATELAPEFDFRYARPGDRYRLTRSSEDDSLVEFQYSPSRLVRYQLRRDGQDYSIDRWEAARARERARVAGVITTSLYESIGQLGEHPRLAGDFADIFAWDVDFSHAVQPGDEFSILYERVHRVLPEGERVYEGPGRILAARYHGVEGSFRAVYFEVQEGQGGYYRPDGTSVQRQFLRAPLSYRRISSGYTLSRLHPILKVRRPHQGIDYAAPTGTPVWAVADGRVTYVGRKGGFGNLVRVRHPNGYESWYGHLSRFPKRLRVGQVVSQKEVIGYVGSTGLSTGPHLDFRMKKEGQWVNPSRIFSPAGPPIPSDSKDHFRIVRDGLLATLEPQPLVVTEEAL